MRYGQGMEVRASTVLVRGDGFAAGTGEAGFLGRIRVPKKAVGSQRQNRIVAGCSWLDASGYQGD